METWDTVISVFCAIGSIGAVIISYIALTRSRRKDNIGDGEKSGAILTELGYIKANTDEIKTEQKEQRKINMEIYSRMAAVEASAKQAHKRLDEVIGHSKED